MEAVIAHTEVQADTFAGASTRLRDRPLRWLVTGSAGFIGSHLVETLLRLGQDVTSLDNFTTGHRHNLDDVRDAVGPDAWRRHRFSAADITDSSSCRRACKGVDIVLHQAALGSVPRSLADPQATHAVNVGGFVNMLTAAKEAGVKRFVYASSSSVYGDHPGLPKVEAHIGRALSPYAVSKLADELYADVFARCYGMTAIGLRYFNVFGTRQDPNGAYAAVVPRWIGSLLAGNRVVVYGDGETSRDFCHVDNVVQANLLAATCELPAAAHEVFNVAVGGRTSLNELFDTLAELVREGHPDRAVPPLLREEERAGDVRHSQADIDKARRILGYRPTVDVRTGLRATIPWYETHLANADTSVLAIRSVGAA
jgi:UDP-N-acetylglucosamine 4-epimerase